MSSFRNPVGPHSAGVYWRRRLLVGGAALLVIVVVLLIVFGRGGGASSAAPTASSSASAASNRTDRVSKSPSGGSAASSPSAAASGAPSGTPSPSATAAASGTCTSSQITVKPIVDKTSYAATEEPKIAMSITNTGSSACTADLGSAEQVLTITSGSETYWTSKDCQTGGTHQNVTIKPGQTLTTPSIPWDRTRSSTTTCDSTRPSVTAGGASYHLEASVDGFTSATSAQFVLH